MTDTATTGTEKSLSRFIPEKSFYWNVLKLAIPIALQSLLTLSVDMVDNVSLGRLGDIAVSAAYLSNQANQIPMNVANGVNAAILILGSQYWGRNDTARIRSIAGVALRIGLGAAMVFAVLYNLFPGQVLRILTNDSQVIGAGGWYLRLVSLSYVFLVIQGIGIMTLRVIEIVRMGTYITALALLLKVILNPLLIFQAGLGLFGAGLSTLIVRFAGAAVVGWYILRKDHVLGIRLPDLLRFDRHLARAFLRYGTPVILGDLTWGINLVARSSIRGHLGPEATAAVSVSLTLFSLVTVLPYALRDVTSIHIGKAVGRDDVPYVKQLSRTFQMIYLAVGLVHGLMLFLLRQPFLMLYPNISDAARGVALQYMAVLSVTLIGTTYQMNALAGIVRAGGQTSFVLFNDLFFAWVIVMPLSLLASYVLRAPAWAVLACLESDQILKCGVAAFKVNRYRWMRNLTR